MNQAPNLSDPTTVSRARTNPTRLRGGRCLVLLAGIALLAVAAGADAQVPDAPAVGAGATGIAGDLVTGVVRGGSEAPLAAVTVYAYRLPDMALRKVVTDIAGNFRFDELPAGLYKFIAYKSGYRPVVVQITRETESRSQTLDLQLLEDEGSGPVAGEDYWSMRERIPPDVLRDIETLEVEMAAAPGSRLELPVDRFHANLQAMAGVDDIVAAGESQLAGGQVGVGGRVGNLDFDLKGDFWRLEPSDSQLSDSAVSGRASAFSFDLQGADESEFAFQSTTNSLDAGSDGAFEAMDFEHYRLSYTRSMGERGSSTVAAQLTNESNFYRQNPIDPVEIPQASQTLDIEGRYSAAVNERATIEGGLRYRERQADLVSGIGADTAALMSGGAERVEVFGRGGYRVRPSLLIEYGAYSVVREDGELALAPKGGIVVQLDPSWQLAARASGQVAASEARSNDFLPSQYGQSEICERGEEHCYQLEVSRRQGDELLTIGAIHREVGETLRLYFDNDAFRPQSLYLVPGDRLPELQVGVSRRLSPNILSRLESNVAAGGGGIYYTNGRDAFENDVRYLITSLDTRFQRTSTGVFLAFHRLEQQLIPLDAELAPISSVESERLQLRLTQDLDVLLDLPADWALHLNMELSRDNQGDSEEDETRHRLLGGIAVSF